MATFAPQPDVSNATANRTRSRLLWSWAIGESLYWWLACLLWANHTLFFSEPDQSINSALLHRPDYAHAYFLFWFISRVAIAPVLDFALLLLAKRTLGFWLCAIEIHGLAGKPVGRIRCALRAVAQMAILWSFFLSNFIFKSIDDKLTMPITMGILLWALILQIFAAISGGRHLNAVDTLSRTRKQVASRPAIVDRRAFWLAFAAMHLAVLASLDPARRWDDGVESQLVELPPPNEAGPSVQPPILP